MKPPRNGRMDQLYPKRKDPDGRHLCRYCGQPVPVGRIWWCSEACVEQAKIVCWPGAAAAACFKRDDYTCQSCGLQDNITHRWQRGIKTSRKPDDLLSLKARAYDVKRSLIEAHHLIPVAAGGGSCGLHNLTTLCQLCHNKTKRKKEAI